MFLLSNVYALHQFFSVVVDRAHYANASQTNENKETGAASLVKR